MDRIESLEMTALECAALLGAETHSYRPKQNYINAVRYDGSLKMAIAVEECCPYSYIEWDEGGNFCGLRAFTEWGIENSKSQFANEGDYLVRVGKRYVLICQEDFEKEYERGEQLPQMHGLVTCECGTVYDVDIESHCPYCGN